MRVAACYIVKNEGENLALSLESLAGSVDEIIVVDTGSTDDTVTVAEKYGAAVYHYAWQNDFAAARNFALEKCHADWIIAIDADEYFTAETKKNIRPILENTEAELLLIRRLDVEKSTGAALNDIYMPRAFRGDLGFRYVGKIHEEVRRGGETIGKVAAAPKEELCLIHTGYSSEIGEEKARRNLNILLAELEAAEKPESLYMYLAETYAGLGEDAKAERYARLDIDLGRRPVIYASRSYRVLLEILAKKNAADRLDIALRAAKDFPEVPEFHAEAAALLAAGGDYARAINEAKAAEKLENTTNALEPSYMTTEMFASLKAQRANWEMQLVAEKNKLEEISSIIFGLLQAKSKNMALIDKLIAKLPISSQCFFADFVHGRELADGEGFLAVQDILFDYADEEQLTKLAPNIAAVDKDVCHKAGDELFAREKWAAAMAFYSEVDESTVENDGGFWKNLGLCLYRLGDYETAAACFAKAKSCGENAKEIAAYEKWLEDLANG